MTADSVIRLPENKSPRYSGTQDFGTHGFPFLEIFMVNNDYLQ